MSFIAARPGTEVTRDRDDQGIRQCELCAGRPRRRRRHADCRNDVRVILTAGGTSSSSRGYRGASPPLPATASLMASETTSCSWRALTPLRACERGTPSFWNAFTNAMNDVTQ